MAFVTIAPADIEAGKPVDNDLMTQIKDNEDANNAATAGAVNYDIPNGDMELTDGTFPANWTLTSYPGGAAGNGLETTAPINGSQSMKFVHPGGGGNGGGYADSDYLPCGEGAPFKLSWLHEATAATMKNQVIIRYFDKDKVFVSATTIYDSIVNPATATQFSGIANPVSTARFYKVRLVGGESSVDVAGTALFDGVTVARVRSSTYTLSGAVPSVELLNLAGSRLLKVHFRNVTISTSGSLALQVSADNGSTWLTSTTYYISTSGSTYFMVGGLIGNPATGTVEVQNLSAADYTLLRTDSFYRVGTPDIVNLNTQAGINSTTAYNAIRFLGTTGNNIATGEFILEELL